VTERRWIDQSQPQTLQAAVMLAYLNAALAALFLVVFRHGIAILPVLALALTAYCAYYIANERRWAYRGAIVLAGLYLLLQIIAFVFSVGLSGILNIIFAVILVVLLVHPESRSYARIYFR
jgi:hypothetical protein